MIFWAEMLLLEGLLVISSAKGRTALAGNWVWMLRMGRLWSWVLKEAWWKGVFLVR